MSDQGANFQIKPNQKRAIILDDSESMRMVLTRFLVSKGWDVVAFSNGEELLDNFEPGHFKLVFSDVDLGDGLDGISVAKRLRESDPGLQIKMMSGDVNNVAKAKEAGLELILKKTFDLSEISALLDEANQAR